MAQLGLETSGPEQAKALMAELTGVAEDTGFAIGDVVTAFRALKDADLSTSAESFKSFANIAAASGSTLTDVADAIVEATAGKYEALADLAVGVSDEGDKLVITARGQSVEIANDAATLVTALERIGQVQFAGAAGEQAASLGDSLSRLTSAATSIVGQSASVQQVTGLINDLAGALDTATKGMAMLAEDTSPAAKAGLGFLQVAFAALQNPLLGAQELVSQLNRGMDETATAAQAATPPTKTLAETLGDLAPKADSAAARVTALNEKLKGLGTTVEQLNAPATSAADVFDALVRSMDVNQDGLLKGLTSALSKVSQEEIPRLSQAWQAASVTGRISAEVFASGTDKIKAKLASIPATVTPLEASFKQLGVTSQASLNATADKARAAWTVIAAGKVPVAQLQAAFSAYAKAATAANNGVVPAAVLAEAAQRGLRVEVEKAASAHRASASAATQAATATTSYTYSTEELAARQAFQDQIAKDGITTLTSRHGELVKLGDAAKTTADYEETLARSGKTLADVSAVDPAPMQQLGDATKAVGAEAVAASEQVKAIANEQTKLSAPTESKHTVTSNVAAILAEILALNGKDTSSTHTIYIKKVETNNAGGLIGLAQRFARGGSVFRLPGWSSVPGTGNEDTVPAALPSGSYVLRQAASRYYGPLLARLNSGGLVDTLLTPGERWFTPQTVNRHGAGLFAALNQLQIPREALAAALDGIGAPIARFNAGGAVGGVSGSGAQNSTETVNVNLSIGARQVKLQGARAQAASLVSALKELQRGL